MSNNDALRRIFLGNVIDFNLIWKSNILNETEERIQERTKILTEKEKQKSR